LVEGAHISIRTKGTLIVSDTTEENYLRVSGGSNAQSVGSAIAHALYENPTVKIRAVGASAVNQAVKAIAIARGYVAPRGLDLVCKPGFTSVESREGKISAIVFIVTAS
jgi:stage V sporulation protein S